MSWKPATKWEGQLKDITWSFGNEDVRFRHEQWREVFEMQLGSTPFSILAAEPLFSLPLGEESVEFTQWLNPKAIWDRYHSKHHSLGSLSLKAFEYEEHTYGAEHVLLLYNLPFISRNRLQRGVLIRDGIALSQVAILEPKELAVS